MTTESKSINGRTQQDRPRLQKVLAAAGLGSRRHCEQYILTGRVTVDGQPADDLGVRVDPSRQEIRLDGEKIKREAKRYYLLNKPPGYLCTNRDPSGRLRVIDLFPKGTPRLFTVGRLDENSQGLLLLTNDGDLANVLAHPRYEIPKTYRVQVSGIPSHETLKQLRRGLHFSDGKFRVHGVRRVRTRGKSAFLEIVLNEGQNREIRRLLARVGHKVMHLERIGFGPLRLGRLGAGRYRPLKTHELKQLRELETAARSVASQDDNQGESPKNRRTSQRRKAKPSDHAGAQK